MIGKGLLSLFVVIMLALSGCSLFVAQPPADQGKVCVDKEKLSAVLTSLNLSIKDLEPAQNPTGAVVEPVQPTEKPTEQPTEKPTEQPTEKPAEQPSDMPVRTYNEGDLVKLSPKASDAEGDKITFTYSEPLDKNGEWQTKAGDAGEYVVTVTASDGKTTSSKQIKLVVKGQNNAPVIADMADIKVAAGEKVSIDPKVTDADNDQVTVKYSGFTDASEFTPSDKDVGEHFVTITASDGKSETKKLVKVTVSLPNRAPVIQKLVPINVKEGALVKVTAAVSDPEDDEVTLAYSEPLDSKGEWQTKAGDAGTYLVTVTATDKSGMQAKETVSIVVESANSAPVITLEDATVSVTEGQTAVVKLSPKVTDAEGDKVTLTFSGFMDEDTKTVSATDAGAHDVTVTASDGKSETTKTIKVTVVKNTPPAFDFG
jgi:VCBS repeat-containing protein